MKNPLTYKNHLPRRAQGGSYVIAFGQTLLLFLLGLVVSLTSHAQSNQCVNPPPGLIAWWSAEGNATDFTGEHSGTFPFGSAFAAGEVGQAFDFDGSYRRVSIADSPAFQLTNAMTLEAWVYPRAYGGFITFRGDNRGGLDTWVIDTYENGFIRFQIDDEANNYQSVRAPLTLNQWQHVAATWNRTSGDMKIYLDGALIQQTNTTIIPIGVLDSGSEPAIGIGNHGGTFHQFPFNGLVDELGIYSRALTPNEIVTIYNASSAGKCTTTNPPSAACATPPSGLVSWWRAEQNATDALGTNSGDALNGVRYTNSPVGTAFYFDGVDDRVIVPNSASLNFGAGDFSIEAWIKPETAATAFGVQSLVNKRYTPNSSAAVGWEFGLIDGLLACQLADAPLTGGDFSTFVSASPDLRDGNYHHVALSIQRGSSTGGKLLVDGQVVLTFDPTSQPGDLSSTEPLRIGAHADASLNSHFTGAVDEVSIYNRALTAGEILAIFNAGVAGKCASGSSFNPADGLVAHYPFSGDASDVSGNGNHGVPGNTALAVDRFGLPNAAFSFNGQNAAVTVADNPALRSLTSNYTFNAWVRFGSNPQIDAAILMKSAGAGDQRKWTFWRHVQAPPYGLGLLLNRVPGQFQWNHNYPFTIGQWYMMTFSASATNCLIAVNGQVVSAQSGNLVLPDTTGSALSIGGAEPAGNQWFDGLLDDIRIYNRTFTSNDIAQIYQIESAQPVSCVNAPVGQVGWWRGEGNPDDGFGTNSGHLLGGATYVAGEVGQGFGFNGTDSYVNIPSSEALKPTGPFTFEAWVRYSGNPGAISSYCIATKGADAEAAMDWALTVSANSRLRPHISVNGGWHYFDCDTPLSAGTWYHVALVYDGAHLQGYVNGVLDGSANVAGLVQTSDAPLRIGAYAPVNGTGSKAFFTGSIDEVSFYHRNLSGGELLAVYLAGSAGKCQTNPPVFNCTPAPSNVVGWWPAAGNADDVVANHNGVLAGTVSYSTGKVGQAFSFNSALAAVVVPASPSLNVGSGAGLTLEVWINPTDVTQTYPLFEWNNATYWGVHFYIAPGQPTGGSSGPAGPGQLYANVVDSSGGWHQLGSAAGAVASGVFQHVVLTYDKASGLATIYRNGEIVSQLNLGSFTPLTTYDLYLGRRQAPSAEAGSFAGLMDEPTVYGRALSQTEVQAIYNAGSAGKCPPQFSQPSITQQPQSVTTNVSATIRFEVAATGVPAPAYQWFFGNTPLANQTNALLLLNNVQPPHAGVYSVQVSNVAGAIFSSNAMLTVDLTQPAWLVDASSVGFYNDSLGTTLDGTAPQFPMPFGTGGGDPEFYPAAEPNLAAGAAILGNWLTNPSSLNSYWRSVTSIPTTWELNTETAIIYAVDGGNHGVSNLRADIDADNGIYVWVNGRYKFGARQPGLPSPLGQYEYTNVFLGELAPGSNYIQILREDSGIADGYQFRFSGTVLATNQPPIITQSPATQTAIGGNTVTFNAAAIGSPDLTFQWQFNGVALAGQSNTSLTLANVQLSQAGAYTFVAANPYGAATSSVATLTVLAFPPVITRQPTNLTAIESTAASFSVQATGSVTLAYQWLFNNAPLAGKTGTSLAFTSVQFSNAGNYSVIVTNLYGAVTSSVATLTVNPRPSCASVHDGLVSWWRGETNALDGWDSNNGNNLGRTYVAGKVGRAFSAPNIVVPDSASLAFTNELTIEAWINPATTSGFNIIPILIRSPQFFQGGSGFVSSYLLGLTNQNRLSFSVGITSLTSTQSIPVNVWTHVAASYSAATGLRLFINGQLVSSRAYNAGIPLIPGTTYIGASGISGSVFGTFPGLLDEVSLYQRALSAAEIQSIFAADLTGKCLAPPVIIEEPQDQTAPVGEDVKLSVAVVGSRPLTYQWRFNNTIIPGATNASLLLEKVKTNQAGHYHVIVTNSLGSDTSVRAQISLLPAPSCTDLLPGLISWWPGDTNTLDAMGLNNIAQYTPVSYPTGKVASAFTFNGVSSRIMINNSASLNFTNNQSFSIEMWIKATNAPPISTGGQTYPNVPLLEKRDSFTAGWLGYSLSLNNGKLAFAMGAPLSLAGGRTNQMFISSGPELRDGFFHHVAVTVSRTENNGGVLYVDGSPVLVFDPRGFTNSLLNQLALYIGGPVTTISNSYYTGLIDEPAIYNRALTAAEILSIRTAGAAGRCKAKPIIVTQPANTNGVAGQNIALSVQATGTPLLKYQWRRTNQPLAGATNATYNITNLSTANIGTYSVIISNAFGAVTSSNAVVALANIPPIAYPGVVSGFEDSQIQIAMQGNDPDNKQPYQGLSFFITSSPTNGILIGTTNSFLRTYTPNPNFFGTDTFTFVANDGIASSSNATFTITVRPVNDAPTAQSQLVATDEDTPIAITLLASDIDGDALTYQVTPPSRGTLSGVAPNLIYTPETNYFGDDLFTFTVRDISNAVSQLAVVSITVRPVNDAPDAKLDITPLDELPGVTNFIAIAPACCDATLRLDASDSTDVENDPLSYAWVEGTNVLATGVTVTNRFKPGTHEIILLVSDGPNVTAATMTVEIITPAEGVAFLKTLVEEGITDHRTRAPLVNWLRQAGEAFECCQVEQGVKFLELFKNRVQSRIAPKDAELAAALIETTSAIIEAAPDCDPCHRLGRKHKDKPGKKDEPHDHRSARPESSQGTTERATSRTR